MTVALAATGEAPTSRTAGGCARGADWPAPDPALAAGVVRLVNAHRRTLHLSTLIRSAALTRSARWKASHMARYRYLRHEDSAPPLERTVSGRLEACGYPAAHGAWGENIAFGFATAPAVMRAWLRSPGHRRGCGQ